MTKRWKFSDQFKAKIALEALRGEASNVARRVVVGGRPEQAAKFN